MKRVLALLAVALLSGSIVFAGQKTLRIVGVNHVVTDAIELKIPEFEKATGIKVALEKYGEDQLNQKLTTEFTAGSSDIDAFMTRPLQEARVMARNKWYVDLKPLAAGTPGYDLDDFSASSRNCVTIDGVVTAIPLVTEAEVLFYRKDVLAKHNLQVPATLDELKKAAQLVTDKKNELYGFVARGQRSPLITQFSSFLYSHGGDWYDQKTRKATVNTPEALAAMDLYGTLLREYGPGGVLNMSWPQAVAVFAQGKAVFYTDASSIFPNILDPAKSTVADQTGVAVFPKGPKGSRMYNVTAWAIGIYSGSSQKEEAWKFIEFMTNKPGITFIQGERGVQCARNSVWASPEGVKSFHADWAKAVADSADGVAHDRPLVVAVGEARDIIGEAVTASIEGKDFKTLATSANARFQAILDREK
ncbi:MAG: sugar ABC transporter substrate-binding protein [Planctomycetota bacterium]|nr:sugar ABC transporter substrate-binding protein [Planctomycetota bacterium]